jgi:ribosomal protein S13
MAQYEEIIEKAIMKEIEVLGEQTALEIAREVDGLKVAEDGTVEALEREEHKVLGELVKRYQKVGGPVSASLIAREVESMISEDMQLPDILGKRIRAEKFASAI